MTPLTSHQRSLVDQLIRTEWPKLERYLRTKVPPAHVHEIAQSVFLGYVERYDAIRSEHKAYLWQIARNQVIKYFERYRTRTGVPFDSEKVPVSELGPTLSSLLDRRNRYVRALQSLPLDLQTAIEWRYGEDLSLQEAADAMGVSLATVKRYLSAAEQQLRDSLGADVSAVARAYRGE